MAQQPSRVQVQPRAKQPRFKVATDENAPTRPRLVNMTAKGSSFLDRKKALVSSKPSVATTQRNALGEIHNVRKKEKENAPSSKLPGASHNKEKDQPAPAAAPAGLKRRRSPSLHAATARPARIPNPPPGAVAATATTATTVSSTTITTTTVRANNENRNSVNLDAPSTKAPVQTQQQQQQPPRRLNRMLQAINGRQSQVLPPRPSAPAPSSTTAKATSTAQKHTSIPFPSTEAPSSVRPVSREIPSSVLPSSRPPSPVPPSELPQDEDEDSEANLATETDDSTVVISTRKPTVSEPKSAVKVEKKEQQPAERDPVKAFEEMKEGDWLYAPAEKRAEYKAYVERVAAEFVDEPELEDATMVAEYAEEIFAYMSKLEEESMPMPDYMNGQQEIDWEMRSTLIDWLLQVHLRYHMLPETLWIAVNIIDRFLSRRVVSVVKLQLVGVTAMFVAAKYEEIIAPSVEEYVKMTGGGYKKEEILKGEKIILQTIDFRISSYCSPYSWVRRISKADDYDLKTRTLCKFLIELTLLDWRFLRVKPSMIAAIGMYSARRMLGQDWNDAFVFYSGKVEEELLMGYEFILEALVRPDFDKQYIFKKYRSKRFLRAAIYAREWALQCWGLPSSVHISILSAEEEMVEEVVEKRTRTDSHRSSIYSVGE